MHDQTIKYTGYRLFHALKYVKLYHIYVLGFNREPMHLRMDGIGLNLQSI